MKCGWPKPKQGVRGRRQDPSALVHPNNPCFTVKSGRSQAMWWPALYTDCGLPNHSASPRPCEASVSTVPWGQPHSGAKGGSKRQEGVGGFGEQNRAGTLFCSPLEMFYEACSHSRVSWSFKWMILRVKGCYVLVTQGQWTHPECPRQTRV